MNKQPAGKQPTGKQPIAGPGWRIVPHPGDSPFKKVRVLRQGIIDELLGHIRRHEYSVLLGAPFSEKTRLLDDLRQALVQMPPFFPITIDLRKVRSDSEDEFFTSLARSIRTQLHAPAIEHLPPDIGGPGRWFQNFLRASLELQTRHIVLIFDHLNILPHDLIHSLLRSLRAHLMERATDATWKIDVVIAGSTDLAALTLSPHSPFNIAHPVILSPLARAQSLALAQETVAAWGKELSDNASELIYTYAGNDCYLIPQLCFMAQEVMAGYRRPQVTTIVIEQAVARLSQNDQANWSVREAIRIIEEEPDTLLDVLAILDNGELARTQSHQAIARGGVDQLQLSGAVLLEGESYRIKNGIYQQRLADHFTHARVGHVLRMTGRWQDAIGYLAPRLQHNQPGQARSDLLEAIVQSIYAADDPDKACRSLAEGIEKGFGLSGIAVYRADVTRSELRLVVDSVQGGQPRHTPINLGDHSLVEAQTFHNNVHALRRGEDARHQLIAALTPEMRPIGIVTVDSYDVPAEYQIRPPHLGELLRFLRQAASAIEQVMMRSAFQEIGRAVLSTGAARSNLQRVLATVSNALGCDFAALYLLDQTARNIRMEVSSGISSQPQITQVSMDDDHPTTRALWRYGEDASKGRMTLERSGQGVIRILLPLLAADETLGVLDLQFALMRHPHIDAEYRATLATFADQVAIAVYNTQLFERTDKALARRVEELEAARLKIQSLSEAELHEVAFAIAHRLSNAVGDVPYSLDVVRKHGAALPSEALQALERVQRRFASISGLILPLQGITRMEDIPFHQLDLTLVLAEAWRRVLPREKVIAQPPTHDRALWIAGNQPLLCDAFQSVLENGCEAMGDEGSLSVAYAIRGEEIQVRITDTGPGVPALLSSRIFELGFSTKVDSAATRGTGLYSCRRILRRHGGDIDCFSVEGEGTTFVITLPLLGEEK